MNEHPLYRNALNAIQTGVEDFNEGSPKRLPSAVRNLTAGILLLCKEKLRQISPYDDLLIWKQFRPRVDENGNMVFARTGSSTVDVLEIKERFKSCDIACDTQLLQRIANVRNSVEHHYVEDAAQIRGAFVDGLRFLTKFMPEHLEVDPRTEIEHSAWKTLIEQKEVEDLIRAECRASYINIEWPPILKEALENEGCPECGSLLIKQNENTNTCVFDATWSCAACGHSGNNQEWTGRVIPQYFSVESFLAAKDGVTGPIDNCPECSEEAYVHAEQMCLSCGFELGEPGECAVCAEPLGLEDYDETLCSYHRYIADKERDR